MEHHRTVVAAVVVKYTPQLCLPTERQQQIHHAQRIKTITSLYTDRVTGESEEVSLSI